MNWKDNFSKQAKSYAQYRPQYPVELYDFLMSLVPHKKRAWDCGTGNGQVAAQLARFFEQVIATDISSAQLAQAQSVLNIDYRVAPAESSGMASHSIDLVTVAQAIHWFDFDKFYQEVQRVTHKESLLAVWGYGLFKISQAFDEMIEHLYHHTLGPYWDRERQHVDSAYQTIPFPFQTIQTPRFKIQLSWCLTELIGYLNTWSSVQHFITVNQSNPIDQLESDLATLWGNPKDAKLIEWEIYLKLGWPNL